MTRLRTSTKISNSNINSGLPINLQAASISEKQSAFSKVYDSPNGSLTPSYSTQLNDFANSGFSNSKYQIRGHYNLKDDHVTGANAVFDREYKNNCMEYSHTKFLLYDNIFVTSGNTSGTIWVCINDITIERENDSVNGHFVTYTLSVTEVIQ